MLIRWEAKAVDGEVDDNVARVSLPQIDDGPQDQDDVAPESDRRRSLFFSRLKVA